MTKHPPSPFAYAKPKTLLDAKIIETSFFKPKSSLNYFIIFYYESKSVYMEHLRKNKLHLLQFSDLMHSIE